MENAVKSKLAYNINSLGIFDFNRGILMLLVIIGHSVNMFYKYWEAESVALWLVPFFVVGKALYYGTVPMFFIMSGFGFRAQKMKKCIKGRVRHLIKPYLGVMIVVTLLAVLKRLLQGASVIEALKYQAFPFLIALCPGETGVLGWYTASIGPIWFLVVLGLSWIGLNLIFKLKSEAMRAVCILTIAAFCTRLPYQAFIPFCIVQSLCCMAYLYIGYCLKKENVFMQQIPKSTMLVLGIILLCIVPFGNIEVSQNVWQLGFLDFIASCVAGFLLLSLLMPCNNFKGKFISLVRKIGKNSLYVLCIHTIEYLVFPWDALAEKIGSHVHMLVGIIAIFIMRVIIIGAGCFLIDRIVKVKRSGKRTVKA